ncbi:hypothetical protein C8J57DRAFT_1650712 [Mycena rebaudengoi]|nr:hypothetical protein C8J57DRAFT_1650712 [Mycena rebaudengoi]
MPETYEYVRGSLGRNDDKTALRNRDGLRTEGRSGKKVGDTPAAVAFVLLSNNQVKCRLKESQKGSEGVDEMSETRLKRKDSKERAGQVESQVQEKLNVTDRHIRFSNLIPNSGTKNSVNRPRIQRRQRRRRFHRATPRHRFHPRSAPPAASPPRAAMPAAKHEMTEVGQTKNERRIAGRRETQKDGCTIRAKSSERKWTALVPLKSAHQEQPHDVHAVRAPILRDGPRVATRARDGNGRRFNGYSTATGRRTTARWVG